MKKNIFWFFCFFAHVILPKSSFCQDTQLEAIAKSESCRFLNDVASINTNSQSDNIDVTYYKCFWSVNPTQNFIIGNVQLNFKAVSLNIDTLFLDLSNSLGCDSIIFHQQSLSFLHQNNQLFIPVQSIQSNDSITIYYHGVPSSSGFALRCIRLVALQKYAE